METQEELKPMVRPEENHPGQNQIMLFSEDPETAFQQAEALVRVVSRRCSGPAYIANIRGKQYPKIEWWTTVSASLGLFPQVVHAKRLERPDEIAYEARVEVYRNGQVIASGEAMCSNRESRWQTADEYAIKSMAITRASGKAYRIPLSFLAVMAGLEVTPAEEMPVFEDHSPVPVSDDSATAKQIEKLESLCQDTRLTDLEQTQLKTMLKQGLTKKRASQVMDHFYGRSVQQNGRWERQTSGVLAER